MNYLVQFALCKALCLPRSERESGRHHVTYNLSQYCICDFLEAARWLSPLSVLERFTSVSLKGRWAPYSVIETQKPGFTFPSSENHVSQVRGQEEELTLVMAGVGAAAHLMPRGGSAGSRGPHQAVPGTSPLLLWQPPGIFAHLPLRVLKLFPQILFFFFHFTQ